jgi:hypothetical protein
MTGRSTARWLPRRGVRPRRAPRSRRSPLTRSRPIRDQSGCGPMLLMISRAILMCRIATCTLARRAWRGRWICWLETGWGLSLPGWIAWLMVCWQGFGERRSWSRSRRLRRHRCYSERAGFCSPSSRSDATVATWMSLRFVPAETLATRRWNSAGVLPERWSPRCGSGAPRVSRAGDRSGRDCVKIRFRYGCRRRGLRRRLLQLAGSGRAVENPPPDRGHCPLSSRPQRPKDLQQVNKRGRLHTARYGAEACGAGGSGSSSK